MDKNYDHISSEKEILKAWETSNVFAAKNRPSTKSFSIIMPPPNANDPLHIGHAMFVTVEDILVRFHRMQGEDVLWLPGTDHAGIETQFVFEKKLAKDGKSRFDFRRGELYEKIWEYVQDNSKVATDQIKRLGASADFSRFKFTLGPEIVDFVLKTFDKLWKDDLVYRSERLVNYCTRCGTSYSELEVDWEEAADKLYFVKYKVADQDKYITIATVRPETIFADVAIAVNPNDKKYKDFVGLTVEVPMTDRVVPIIASEKVDIEFGTGALKITPGHDQTDFEIFKEFLGKEPQLGQDYFLAVDHRGKTTDLTSIPGTSVIEAREKSVTLLQESGSLEKTQEYVHRIGKCYRCARIIEPLPLPQFFIKTKPLAEAAVRSLDQKETIIHGAGREAILRNWLENLRDWNISRQIVWGIRIPVWYKVDKHTENIWVSFLAKDGVFHETKALNQLLDEGFTLEEIESGIQRLQAASKPNEPEWVVSTTRPAGDWIQETDTFDTWFSSGQWPVATLMTGQEGDFEHFYPTNVMETAYDILIFWVMRMMLLSIYLTGKSPFKDVYLHGLIRDEKGQKMSKSKGNVVNPLDIVEKYGADALRMSLVMSSTPGQDKNVGEGQIRGMRNMCNKIWNSVRFLTMMEDDTRQTSNQFDKKLSEVVNEVTKLLEDLKPGLAAEIAYNEFWHWFCDEAIEEAKQGKLSKKDIQKGMDVFLKLLHPFVPFVTEKCYMALHEGEILAGSQWPQSDSMNS
jgi:valyl-tRNA synthetase